MNSTAMLAVLDALIPPLGELPGGSIAAATLLASPEAAQILAALPDDAAETPLAAWDELAASDPYGVSAVQHLLSGAYFADARVRAHYGLDVAARPERQNARLADLLNDVPHAPRLPERNPS